MKEKNNERKKYCKKDRKAETKTERNERYNKKE